MQSLKFLLILSACLGIACGMPFGDDFLNDDFETPLVEKSEYRLPRVIMPDNYEISLRPYLMPQDGNKRFTFDGTAIISVKVLNNTRSIFMHSKNLNYTVRQYNAIPNGIKKDLKIANPNPSTDIIEYVLDEQLMANTNYVLYFEYTGSMDDDMHGFYRSSYTDPKNMTKWLASTQFQTNHARRAFPCFDEPNFKATFEVSITRHKSMKAVSNHHLSSSIKNGDYITDKFQKTERMSSYLVAFIISEFNERYNGDFGVIARPEYYHQTEYAFEVGQELLKALDDYLRIPYYGRGIDKMHMAAIPDFSAGAMENWGLLTYRERSLLYDPESTTLSAKQAIAGVIAHEQAHMWFGDMVTCDWWGVTWLNEGFARFFQYFATSWVEKEFHMDHQFVVAQVQSVMNMDSTNSTNPLTDPDTFTPADLSRMFNSISYNKGASFIRMTESVLGAENFRNSLNEYLLENLYKNTLPENLFVFWRKYWPSSHKDHADPYFLSFTEQVGYPVMHISVSDDRRSFRIRQERFLLKKNDGSDASLLYTVPITYTHSQEKNFATTTPKFFLPANSAEMTQQLSTNISWLIANIQEIGYYRVNYDEKSWHQIHHALYNPNWDGIHDLNRAQIVDDLFNLARASYIDYALAMNILEYLETETEYSPWTAAFNGYSYLSIRLGTNINDFKFYITALLDKAYKKLGFEHKMNDTALDIYNRANVLSWSCRYGNSDCIEKSYAIFHDLMSNGTPVPVNIRSPVYCSNMREETNGHHFNVLRNKYLTETVPTEATLILTALGCVKNTTLIEEVFKMILSDDIRRQDKASTLTGLYTSNNENVWPVYQLTTEHFEQLATAMGSYSAVASAISGMASRFTEEQQKEDLKKFNDQNGSKFGSSLATLRAAERTVDENLAWSKEKLPAITNYLKDFRNSASSLIKSSAIFSMLLIVITSMIIR